MYDKRYFESYAKAPEDWKRGYLSRRYSYRGVERLLRRACPASASMAEFGCGLGMFSFHMLKKRPALKVDAFDISPYAVSIARARLESFPHVTVREGDAQDTGLATGAYDMVVSLDVAEHLPDPEQMFAEAWRVLKSGGILFFSTPNPESLGARLKRPRVQLPAGDGGPVADRWFADNDDTHVNIRSRASWQELCRRIGFVRLRDGTDSLWDTPYFRRLPVLPQKLLGNGSQRLLIPLFGILPWSLGENYMGLWQKP